MSSAHLRKRRTREHVIADLSVNHVERQVLLCGYTVERMVHDYGIDLLLTTYTDDGEVEENFLTMQLKATDRLALSADGTAAPYQISTADLRYWLRNTNPVILVVYDAADDRAYWVYIQRYAAEQQLKPGELGATVTIRVPTANVFTPQSVRLFRDFKNRIAAQATVVVRHTDG